MSKPSSRAFREVLAVATRHLVRRGDLVQLRIAPLLAHEAATAVAALAATSLPAELGLGLQRLAWRCTRVLLG